MFLRKLTLSNFRVHRARAALTISAIALAVSLVVAVTSGFESMRTTAHRFLNMFLGSVDVSITRSNSGDPGGVPESLVGELMNDPGVKGVILRVEESVSLISRRGRPMRPEIYGVDPEHDTIRDRTDIRAGKWFTGAEGNSAVIDQVAAEMLNVKVGDSFTLGSTESPLTLQVVGIVQKPQILAMFKQSIYLPLRTAQAFLKINNPPAVTRLAIDLQPEADEKQFVDRWKPKLAQIDSRLNLKLQRQSSEELDSHLMGLQALSYLGGTVSMLAAMFIVFSAQSMGVSERQRTLAMMRAIGCYKSQIGLLVLLEGMMLAAMGLLVGVPLGALWLKLLSMRFDFIFTEGIAISWPGVAFACVGTAAAALVASILPSYTAMRVSPLEAMTPLAQPTRPRTPVICALVGLFLASLDSILLFAPGNVIPQDVKFYGHFVIGLPGIMIGFFLVAPLLVKLVETVLGPIVAPMFGLKFAMLRQQLSSGMWRAAGTCAALMVGLAILVVMQTNGNSMLNSWKLPTPFPDIFIFSPVAALDESQQAKFEQIPGIKKGDVMPIAIAQPGLMSKFFGDAAILTAALMPDATMFFGVDPDKAFRMMALDFRDGTPEEATRLLKQGRHIVVTQEFKEIKGLGRGDKITLETPKMGRQEYTIAGVVWSPGIDLIVSQFDMGSQFDQRTAGSIFGSLQDAKNDFGIDKVRLFAANLELGVPKERIMAGLQQRLAVEGMQAGDVRVIKSRIEKTFRKLLMMVSTVAFAAMAVSSLGVTNTIMASVRSRRWQFGVLRSIGFTRLQLLRLVLAEGFLLSLVGVTLGLMAGFTMTFNSRKLSAIIVGASPPIDVPWGMVGTGIALVVGVSLLASLWPATAVARAQPLSLLQAGRASV